MEKDARRKSAPPDTSRARREQLRFAKRAQRARERHAGVKTVALKLAAADAERLQAAAAQAGFAQRLGRFLDEELVDVDAYENLKGLCWNRRGRYLAAEEALRLYERNWRLVDTRRMSAAERELIERLAVRFGNGVLNV